MELIETYLRSVLAGNPVSSNNLVIAPVYRQRTASLDYLTLEEALNDGLSMEELPRMDVESLQAENTSEKQVLIIAGEVVVGGKQNRMVASNVFLEKSFKGTIPTRCVEHGRSSGKQGHFTYGGYSTSDMKFSSTQHDVWDSISSTMALTGSSSSTRDYSEVLKNKERDLQEYVKSFPLAEGQIGLVTVIFLPAKRKLIADLFEQQLVCKKHYERIVKAHALEALTCKSERGETSSEEIEEFLEGLAAANFRKEQSVSAGQNYLLRSERAEGSALLFKNYVLYLTAQSVEPGRKRRQEPDRTMVGSEQRRKEPARKEAPVGAVA